MSQGLPSAERSLWADLFSRLVAYGLPMAYFLVTVSFYLKTYDSAQIKITLAQIGCTMVILCWLAQLVLERRWPFRRDDLLMAAPFLAFLISGVVSFWQSSFLAGSFEEFLRRVLYCFMGIIVLVEFRGWDRHRRLLRWLLAAFGVCVFYGFVQYFDTRLFPPGPTGLDPFVWRQAFGLRPFSTFGNPNFYGNFLVIITPIIIAVYLRSGGRIFRPYLLTAVMCVLVYFSDRLFVGAFGGTDAASRVWVILGLVAASLGAVVLVWWKTPAAAASGMLLFFGAMFTNLYATETKGAWLGFLGALVGTSVLVGLFFTGENARKTVQKLLLVVLVTVILGGAIVGFYARRRIQSVSFRVFTWIATFEMIRAQPVLGSGIGSFKWAYPAYRRPEIILIEDKSNTETDHSEDEYLEVWYDEGTVGFCVFLWLILTVSVLGVRALYQLSRLPDGRAPPATGTAQKPAAPPHYSERAYSLLAYTGAWWGALVHWLMDVSVRFVSSGIYSVLLPGLVASLIRHEHMPPRQDVCSEVDRSVRGGLALFWVVVFLSLKMPLGPVLLVGAALWALLEALEYRLTPEVPAVVEPAPPLRKMAVWQGLALAALLWAWGYGFSIFHNFFMADINHNIAIFFSKQGVWTQAPEFETAVANFPPEMQQEYRQVGGALEHYLKVVDLNPFFPMARYFIGNVYNDWGSNLLSQAVDAKNRGDTAKAEENKKRAEELWRTALSTYEKLKGFAPNYVQTHHQVGLVYLKLGDMERAWGNVKKSDEYWDVALKNFSLYHHLDPVFPPNYYREAYIYFTRGQYDKAEKAYLGALEFNAQNVLGLIKEMRNAETYINLGRLMYIQWVNKYPGQGVLPANEEMFKKAESHYRSALAVCDKTESVEGPRWMAEAVKGLAILYARAGQREPSTQMWLRLRALRPDDPDVKSVFRQAAPQ